MYKPIDKIEISGRKSLDITNLIDIISINNLIENDPDIICFSYIPEKGLSSSENELLEILDEEGFQVEIVLALDEEKFYVIRKNDI